MSYVAQVEFFLLKFEKDVSLGTIVQECLSRAAEDMDLVFAGVEVPSRIKAVVRFFDEDGALTALAKECEETDKQCTELVSVLEHAKGFRRRWIYFWHKRTLSRHLCLNAKRLRLAQEKFFETMRKSGNVAIERANFSFRFVEGNEAHELCDRVRKASNVWIFIFEKDDLLFESGEIIAASI